MNANKCEYGNVRTKDCSDYSVDCDCDFHMALEKIWKYWNGKWKNFDLKLSIEQKNLVFFVLI